MKRHPPSPASFIFTSDSDKSPTDTHPTGHGTCVASKAVGLRNGVSKASLLIPVKIQYNLESLTEGFEAVLDHVHLHHLQGTAVIVCSISSREPYVGSTARWNPLQQTLNILMRREGVVVVMAAGNHASRDHNIDTLPAAFAHNDADLITVGATMHTGVRATFSQAIDHQSLWAIGERIDCAGLHEDVKKSGTSFAAPAVSQIHCPITRVEPRTK